MLYIIENCYKLNQIVVNKINKKSLCLNINFIFNYSKKEYQERVDKIQGLISDLDSHLGRLSNYRSQLSGIWTDEAGSSVAQSIDRTMRITATKMRNAEAVMRTFQNMIENLDEGQAQWNSQLEEALGLLTDLDV